MALIKSAARGDMLKKHFQEQDDMARVAIYKRPAFPLEDVARIQRNHDRHIALKAKGNADLAKIEDEFYSPGGMHPFEARMERKEFANNVRDRLNPEASARIRKYRVRASRIIEDFNGRAFSYDMKDAKDFATRNRLKNEAFAKNLLDGQIEGEALVHAGRRGNEVQAFNEMTRKLDSENRKLISENRKANVWMDAHNDGVAFVRKMRAQKALKRNLGIGLGAAAALAGGGYLAHKLYQSRKAND